MALIAHWPLTKDLKDTINGYEAIPYDISSFESSRLGDGLKLFPTGRLTIPTIVTDELFSKHGMNINFHDVSISVWMKSDILSTDVSGGAFDNWIFHYGTYYGTDSGGIGLQSGSLMGYFRATGASGWTRTFSTTSGLDIYNNGGWIHYVFNFVDSDKFNLYMNGNLIHTTNFTTINSSDGSKEFVFGKNMDAQINDIRIYSHSLSEKEIKELSKGLILHYPMDDPYIEPTENLLNVDTWLTNSVSNGSTYISVIDVSNEYKEFNTVKRIERIQEGNSYHNNTSGITINDQSNFTFSLWARKLNNFDSLDRLRMYMSDNVTQNTGQSSVYHTLTNEWQRFSTTLVPAEGSTSLYRLAIHFDNISNGTIIEIADMQLEAKDHPTPFTENIREVKEIKDLSGFNNYAIFPQISRIPKYSENSTVNNGSLDFSGNKFFSIPNRKEMVTEQITVSAWAYRSNWNQSTGERIISNTETGGWQLGFNDTPGYLTFQVYLSNNSYLTPRPPGVLLNTISPGWHLVTGTFDGRYAKFYLDGELKETNDTGSMKAIKYNPVNNTFIGAEPTDNTTNPGGQYWTGLINDVRIYATALSDEDILELYRNRVSFDNKGNVFNYHIEQDVYNSKNLITNGYGELANNYNFPGWTYDPSFGGFSLTAGRSTLITSEFIKAIGNGIDTYDRYKISGEFRQPTGTMSRYYYFLSCYDKNKNRIDYRHARTITETNTFITEEVKNGDTYVTVSSTSNWYDNSTENYVHQKQMKWFPPNHEYPDYTYSRIITRYTHIDHVNNRIYLETPWNLGTFPINTKVTNTSDGGNYSYIAAGNDLMTEEWVYKEGQTSNTQSHNGMRCGTEYIKVGWIMNRDAGGPVTTNIRNIKLENLDSDQTIPTKFEVKSTGSINPNIINQIDHNLNQETTKQRLKEDGTLEIDGYIIQN